MANNTAKNPGSWRRRLTAAHDQLTTTLVRFGVGDAVRRRCHQRIRGLAIDIRAPSTAEALCAAVAMRTGRPIHLVPMTMAPMGPCGLWIATQDADFIITDPTTSPVLRQHTVLHELGHIILEHRGFPDSTTMVASLGALEPDMIRQILGRSAFDEYDEREAEVCADVLAERFARHLGPIVDSPVGWR